VYAWDVHWLLRFDEDAFRAIHVGLGNPGLDILMLILSTSGLGWVQGLFALLLLRWNGTKYYVLPLLTTIIVAGIPVAQLLKRIMPRDRPSNLFYSKPHETFYANSFPSGHTATSFAVATMLFLMTYRSKNAWIGQLALVWASLVGVSRIYRGIHWPTDVIAGAFAGIFTACLVYLCLKALGKQLHLDQPSATISGS
jgi:undecaprenyl-diphosphatase